MKQLLAAGLALALLAAPASAALRLFFSTNGAFSNNVVNSVPLAAGDLPGAPSNPTVANNTILYLWAQMIGPPTSQVWNGISFDVHVEGGTVQSAVLYNYTVIDPDFGDILYRRWQGVNQGTGLGTANLVNVNLAGVTAGEGVNNGPNADDYDKQSEIGFIGPVAGARTLPKSTLLGWVRVQALAPQAQVFLRVGNGGISRVGSPSPESVYLGVGDENAGLSGSSFGQQSPVADAVVTPEPAGIALLSIGALGLLRRRG